MRKGKAKFKLNKKQVSSLGGVLALLIVVGGGGLYLSQKDNVKTPETKKQEEIQQNLENKEKQIEKNNTETSAKADTPTSQTATTTTPETTALTSLTSASITATKYGTTVNLNVYGIGSGKYEVEKNGKIILPATSYPGHGGLELPNLTETNASYQVFLVVNGKRTASSKVINVNSSFTETMEFKGV
jgi:cytoskeletal protein RodZ